MKATRLSLICALCLAAVLLVVMNVQSVRTPINFKDTKNAREPIIKERLIDLRAAQNQYHHVYGKYTANPDSLVIFLQTTPIKSVYKEQTLNEEHFEKLKLNEDKVAKMIDNAKKKALNNKKLNLDPNDLDALYAYIWANDKDIINNKLQNFRRDTIESNMIDSLYHGRFTAETIKDIIYVPFSDGDTIIFKVNNAFPTNQGDVALFEMIAPYKSFLGDLNKQELANLIDSESKLEISRKDPHGYYNLKNSDVIVGLKVGDVDAPNGGHGNWE